MGGLSKLGAYAGSRFEKLNRFIEGKPPLAIATDAGRRFARHNAIEWAGHIAFSFLFSFFPFLILLASLASVLGTVDSARRFSELAFEFLPVEVAETLSPIVAEILSGDREGLLTISVLGTLWAASSGVEALRTALNQAHEVRRVRPMWIRRIQDIVIVIVGTCAVGFLVITIVVGPVLWQAIAPYFEFTAGDRWIWGALRYGAGAVVLILAFAGLYYWLPNTRVRAKEVFAGASFAAIAWLLGATLLAVYFANFKDFAATYGSLGGIIATLTFLYVSAAIFILGAEINAVIAERRRSDRGARAKFRRPRRAG